MTAEATGQGVLVVLNEEISAARDVRKTDNRRAETFGSESETGLPRQNIDGSPVSLEQGNPPYF